MRDMEDEAYANISYVREKFAETAKLFNFKMMEPSPLEMLATLEAKSGAAISNEIYAFKDKGDRDVALRFDLREHPVAHEDLRPQGIEIPSLAEAELKLIEGEYAYVRQRGVMPGTETIVLRDPAGNWVELIELRSV